MGEKEPKTDNNSASSDCDGKKNINQSHCNSGKFNFEQSRQG